jgi:hypothetical protein
MFGPVVGPSDATAGDAVEDGDNEGPGLAGDAVGSGGGDAAGVTTAATGVDSLGVPEPEAATHAATIATVARRANAPGSVPPMAGFERTRGTNRRSGIAHDRDRDIGIGDGR